MYRVRPFTDADSEAYARLLQESPDTGQLQFARHFTLDPHVALPVLHPDAVVAVAEHEAGGLAGTGTVSFGSMWLLDRLVPSAYLSALAVHPAHRRQGVATMLATWRFREAQARGGDAGVIYALIQQGNAGSLHTARAWQHRLAGQVVVSPVPVRRKPIAARPDVHVRSAETHEWETIAEHLSTFNHAFAFAPHFTAAELRAWHREHLAGRPWRHYLVATDGAGKILAGLGMSELSRISVLKVTAMPFALRLLNAAFRLAPPDGTFRLVQAEKAFFSPGCEDAARHLFQTARHVWGKLGSHLGVRSRACTRMTAQTSVRLSFRLLRKARPLRSSTATAVTTECTYGFWPASNPCLTAVRISRGGFIRR